MTLDEQIRQAGSRLAAVTVPVPDLGRVARRRRRLRAAAATGAAATLVAAGALMLWPDPEPARLETGVANGAVPAYELDLGGAELVSDETLTASVTDGALWADEARQTYLSLAVRRGLAEAYPEPAGLPPMQEYTPFPATQGRAWFTEAAGQVRSMRMWWSRPDGDVWFVTAYWHGEQPVPATDASAALRDWALGIDPGPTDTSDAPYVIGDPALRLVASQDAGVVRSRARVWRWRGHEITLLAIEDSVASGLSNLLAHGVPERVTVDGHEGWMVTSASPAETVIGWQVDTPHPAWVTLTIPPELTETDEILASLTPE